MFLRASTTSFNLKDQFLTFFVCLNLLYFMSAYTFSLFSVLPYSFGIFLSLFVLFLLIIFAGNRAERAVYDACHNPLLEASTHLHE